MLVVLILGVMGAVAIGVLLLQRKQTRKSSHKKTYFSHTLGVSDPPLPAAKVAKDETPAA